MKKALFIILAVHASLMTLAQPMDLYPSTVPNSKPGSTNPVLIPFLPAADKATGAAIIVCPGGGYFGLAMDYEGTDVAEKLSTMGIAAFVLRYRLPKDATMMNKEIGPLQDAQRAIQLVRERAAEWHIDTARVGILGFSAGGHLASTAGTHFQKAYIDNPKNTSLRPSFMVLLYPVISFSDSLCHRGSRDQLIGLHPDAATVKKYSNELQVTRDTPPAFLVHAGDDKTVKVGNSINFYIALQRFGINAEMLIYPHGGHGFGMKNPTTKDLWMDNLYNWMDASGWLKK